MLLLPYLKRSRNRTTKPGDTPPPPLPPSRASEDLLDSLENQQRTPDNVRSVDAAFWVGAVVGTLVLAAAVILLVRG